MKKRYLLFLPLYLLVAAAETGFGPILWQCNPPYLLCATVLAAFFFGEKIGAAVGFVSGLILDFGSSLGFGIRAAVYLILGYLLGVLAITILTRNPIVCILFGTTVCAVAEIALWTVRNLSATFSFADGVRYVILPRTLMGIPLIAIGYFVFSRLVSRSSERLSFRR